ncbi:MAG TPA: gamma carbonic anhydrase family protein [Coxiellaceae bacterium]|nr:gamma carbonic anhydrase family protein [Coxiellaceae bacterium]
MIRVFQHKYPVIAKSAYVDESAVVIGDVELGEESSVWPHAVLRGDIHSIRVGARSNIQDGTVVHVTRPSHLHPAGFPVVIGEDVTVGHHVTLHACTIENECLIGMGAIVLDGVHVESHVMIGAGSLVAPHKRLKNGYLYLGQPAKCVRPLTEEERAFLKESAENYVALKNAYLL